MIDINLLIYSEVFLHFTKGQYTLAFYVSCKTVFI